MPLSVCGFNNMKVKLLKPHTDSGIDYQAGDEIDLSDDSAAWLVGIGSAEPAQTAAKKTSRKQEE